MNIPKIEYEVYYPLFNEELIKLNLTVCKDSKVEITVPVRIDNNNLDKYNTSSDYYNDICLKTTSDRGTDLSLIDRKKLFIENNMTLCEEDCNLVDYDQTNEKAKCSCLIKISLPFIDDIKFDKEKLYNRFKNVVNIANMKLLKCYKNVFNKYSLKRNYGFLIHIFIYILFFICLFLFYCKYYYLLKNQINAIEKAKEEKFNKGNKKKENICNANTNNILDNRNRRKTYNQSKMKSIIKTDNNEERKNNDKSFKISLPSSPPMKTQIKKRKSQKINRITRNSNISSINNINNINLKKNNNIISTNINDQNKKEFKDKIILEYNDYELNSLLYKNALLNDRRSFVQYYISLIRTNHLFFFSFYCNNKDYNSQIIKFFLFFLFFAVYLIVNALFFNDNNMHKIYLDEGEFNFIYQVPQIIYSILVSAVITSLIKYFALSRNLILEIKHAKSKDELQLRFNKNLNILNIRFSLFFIITFILLFIFMYYISCFCGIYVNNQTHLIKDSIISFGASLIYPFGIYLIPGIFRMNALKAKNKDKEYQYKFSLFIQYVL